MQPILLCLPLLLCLMFARCVPGLPLFDVNSQDLQTLVELLKIPNNTDALNEYYGAIMLPPEIVKLDYEEDFSSTTPMPELEKKITRIAVDPFPEIFIWEVMKTFYKYIKSFAQILADPIPAISNAIDYIKSSTAWKGISAFFTQGYDLVAHILKEIFYWQVEYTN